ncbi:P-loop containing nucleoside triphosphate hydrolase protein, partial [Suillus spraguei]
MEVVDAGAVSVGPARYAELHAIIGSQASFRSKEQAAAVELTAQRKHNLFLILGTGGGKSLVFMAAAANAEEIKQGLMTVVIVPLRALLRDMCRRLDEKDIKYCEWATGTSDVRPNTRCILVTADAAASPPFLTFLHKIFHAKRLARVVLDEVHTILTSEHYRPLLGCLGHLRELAVQLLLLTATMPVAGTAQLLQKLQILPATTKLIRASTARPNIIYSRFKIDSRDPSRLTFTDVGGGRQSIVTFIVNYSHNLQAGDRILVYCLTRNDAQSLAGKLDCDFYHAKLDEACQDRIYKQWTSSQGSRILTTTSCLGAGMDYPAVRMVVHWKLPRNLLDKEQESGRAGRDGGEACSVV